MEVNGEAVESHRERLFERFGDRPIETRTEDVDRETFETRRAFCEDGYLGSAYALVRREPAQLAPPSESHSVPGEERERVLLVLPRGGSRWGVPGGGREDDETFPETARREIREETGVTAETTGLAWIRHEITTCDASEDRLHVLRVFFQATYVDGSVSIQPGEVAGAAWVREPPDRLLPETERLLEGWQADDPDRAQTG